MMQQEHTYDVTWFPHDMIEDCWESVLQPNIEPALTSSGYSIEDVREGLLYGFWRILIVFKDREPIAVCTYRVITYPNCNALHVFTLSGKEMEYWLDDLILTLRELARAQACDIISASCRRGLGKVLKNKGWREQAVVMNLALDS